nr:protein alp1-like [Quercus suber]
MAHESQDVEDKKWPPHVEHIFIEIMVEEQIKGNMENGVFKGPMWETMTQELNKRSSKLLTAKQVFQKHNRLRGKQCKWSQLLNHTGLGWDEATQTVTCTDKISSNTPTLNSDEERALEDELVADVAPIHLDDDCYTLNLDSIPRTAEETDSVDQTQAVGKRPVQEASAKGKKMVKKSEKVSEMIVALKEYTAMTRVRFSVGGDPCSLGKAIDMLNQYVDLNNKEYLKISRALHVKENRVVTMASRSEWLDAFLAYDFDESYFDAMGADDAGDDTNDDNWWGSECDSNDEAEFDFVNPLVVDGLISHGYLKEGQGDVDAMQAVAMLLYILGHNTRMRVLRALHLYARHLIKPDPDVGCLPEHLRVNKYYLWFENCVGAMDGTHVSVRPPKHVTQAYRLRKSTVTTNVLCVCNMDMQFIYVHAGWEGNANDSRVFEEVIGDPKHGFPWPPTGSYYLVDSGLPIGTSFLPPHKSTRYHAQGFHSSNRTPTTKKELFNYRHSSLRMVIERSFGVLKACFPILNLMPNFKRSRQRYVITACCCLHNFMCINNRCDELFNTWDNVEYEGNPVVLPGSGNNGVSTSIANQRHVVEMSDASKRCVAGFRDDITDAMWTDYVARRT